MSDNALNPNHPDPTRVVIVGAGPIGLELATALARRRVPFEIVDAGAIGQTMTWWAPQTRWFSSNERIAIAGVPLVTPDQSKATREQYLTYLRGVAMQFGIHVRTYEPVIGIRSEPPGFIVLTEHTEIPTETIVLACGGTDFPRALAVPGEDLPHVDGYLREPHRYFGRKVLIIGGRNSAVEAALRLHHAGAEVSISYRGDDLPEDGIKYWLRPEIRGLVQAGRIHGYFATRPTRITPTHVVLEQRGCGESIEVAADDVLSLIGYEQSKSLFHMAGLTLTDESLRPVIDERTMESSVPKIYVAGTAVAGTQTSRYKTFLENCHEHVDKIVAHLTNQTPDTRDETLQKQIAAEPES